MSAKAGDTEARAEDPGRRKRARGQRRGRDRALAPVTVAQRLGIPVAAIARAMRTAGVTAQITEAAARRWTDDPGTAPQWLVLLRGEQLASAAETE